MIGHFGHPYSGLGVSDSHIEPAELGKHDRKHGRVVRRRIPYVVAFLSVAYALAGRVDEALALGAEALEILRRRPKTYNFPGYILLNAAMLNLLAGRIHEATAHAREALAITHRLGARSNEAHALYLTGETVPTGDVKDAEGYYREALTLAEPRGMRPLVAHCHFGLGKRNLRMGDHREAKDQLTIATAMYREMNMTYCGRA